MIATAMGNQDPNKRPLTLAECRTRALKLLGSDRVILDECTTTFPWGWAFVGATPEYARTRRQEHSLIGEGPILVDRFTGHAEGTGSRLPVTAWARSFERRQGYRPWWRLWGTLSGCECASLPFAFNVGESSSFRSRLAPVERGQCFTLEKCRRCGAYWCLEAPVAPSTQFAVCVSDSTDFESVAEQRLKLHLATVYGGLTTEPCRMANCPNHRVEWAELCVDHLWESGVREFAKGTGGEVR